jgi:hypothetical protein
MSQGRPAIPRELERALFIEAGYRCAIPTCRAVAPLEIDHIEEWAKVQEHKFENMIVLCANCHGRKGNQRGQLDRPALRQYKASLALLNHRYGEFERRVLDYFAQDPHTQIILLPGGMELLLHYLVTDGYLSEMQGWTPAFYASYEGVDAEGRQISANIPSQVAYVLTIAGSEFVQNWKEGKAVA